MKNIDYASSFITHASSFITANESRIVTFAFIGVDFYQVSGLLKKFLNFQFETFGQRNNSDAWHIYFLKVF